MTEKTYTIKIAGPAGLGIKSIGQIFSKILIDHGFYVADYSEYPSLVRGGHNTYQISFSKSKVFSPHHTVDLFFSVKAGHWQQHSSEFHSKTLIFSDENLDKKDLKKGIFFNLPLKQLSDEIGNPVVANTISLGVATYLLNLSFKICQDTVCHFYKSFADLNYRALDAGYKYADQNFSKCRTDLNINIKTTSDTNFYEGNEAFGWGLIQGKGNFYSAYPMTPATGTMHFLAAKSVSMENLKVIHAEDEIGAANIAAGAAFAGARSATGTSGGGFALMNEAISFCGVTEIGLVFYLVSRPGPATGLPTWTAQGDMLYAINSGHGEFPKVVLAPGDLQESFEDGINSLNLAARLQTPIIVLSDKFLAESGSSNPDLSKIKPKVDYGDIETKPELGFRRYQFSKTGISARTLPGTKNGQFLSNSYEHDEFGFSTEDPIESEKMFHKRQLKNQVALKLAPKVNFFGNKSAKKLIISWGSTKGPILEALKQLPHKTDFAFLQIRTLWPINPDIKKLIDPFKEIVVIENNGTNQLVTLLKSQFDFNPTQTIAKNNGRPFFPEDIIKILEVRK